MQPSAEPVTHYGVVGGWSKQLEPLKVSLDADSAAFQEHVQGPLRATHLTTGNMLNPSSANNEELNVS